MELVTLPQYTPVLPEGEPAETLGQGNAILYAASGPEAPHYAFTEPVIQARKDDDGRIAPPRAVLLDRTVATALVLFVIFLVVNVVSRRFVIDSTVLVVLLLGALTLRVTDAIARRDWH